ncbi:MAG TPA: hypothetical protein VMM55_06160 [Thermohalobaculum sp.]|nr:hypothetical protein [Thermohalobaculum sp.]
MKSRKMLVASLIAGISFILMPEAASAEPKHCPPGHAMKGECRLGSGSAKFRGDRDDHRGSLRLQDGLDDAYDEGYRDALDDLRVGQRLPRDRYRILDRSLYQDRYGRSLDDGYYYAEANGEQLLIEAATGAIVDLLLR